MKKIILIIFLNIICFSSPLKIKDYFINYWENIEKNDFKNNYINYELPYQKFLFSYKRYIKLVKKYEKDIRIIKIKNIKCNKNKCIINYIGYNNKYHYKFSDKDIWYNINHKWYHYFRYEKIF